MDVSPGRRRGVSEILAAVLMLALTIIGFAIIAPLLVTNTQNQASSIINDIKSGELQEGEALTFVYQHANFTASEPYVNFGLLNYGSTPISIKYLFVFNGSQAYQVQDYLLKDVTADSAAQDCVTSPCGEIAAQHVSMLTIDPVSGSAIAQAMDPKNTNSTYELVVYSTSDLAYTFTGS